MHDNIEVQDLRQEQAPLAYRQTVLLGLEAVENALVTHREARRRFDKLREAEGVERRAVALTHDRYRSGLVDFLHGLETERTLYTAQTEPGARRARRLPGSRPIVQGARRWLGPRHRQGAGKRHRRGPFQE